MLNKNNLCFCVFTLILIDCFVFTAWFPLSIHKWQGWPKSIMNCALSCKTHSALSIRHTVTHTPTTLEERLLCPSRSCTVLHTQALWGTDSSPLLPMQCDKSLQELCWYLQHSSDLCLASSPRECTERSLIHNPLPPWFKNMNWRTAWFWGGVTKLLPTSLLTLDVPQRQNTFWIAFIQK